MLPGKPATRRRWRCLDLPRLRQAVKSGAVLAIPQLGRQALREIYLWLADRPESWEASPDNGQI